MGMSFNISFSHSCTSFPSTYVIRKVLLRAGTEIHNLSNLEGILAVKSSIQPEVSLCRKSLLELLCFGQLGQPGTAVNSLS